MPSPTTSKQREGSSPLEKANSLKEWVSKNSKKKSPSSPGSSNSKNKLKPKGDYSLFTFKAPVVKTLEWEIRGLKNEVALQRRRIIELEDKLIESNARANSYYDELKTCFKQVSQLKAVRSR